ncbi:KI13B protein, partial [Atractosteus spatula]|nr:KI13B protein [Atractosteus spatula]
MSCILPHIEKDLKTKCVVEMEGNQTILHPATGNLGKGDIRSENEPSVVFAYDYCFWSMDESEKEKFAGQDVVFQCLGESLLQNAFQGYNACIFAYGQTGSGKSYTMMGSADQPGLIPRLCSALFERTLQYQREEESFTVEVSYMEIYNEKVRDLLDPKGTSVLRLIRRTAPVYSIVSPSLYWGIRTHMDRRDIESLMSEGNKSRTVAATNMNEESSRSHAVFNIILTHTLKDIQSGYFLKVLNYLFKVLNYLLVCIKSPSFTTNNFEIDEIMKLINRSRTWFTVTYTQLCLKYSTVQHCCGLVVDEVEILFVTLLTLKVCVKRCSSFFLITFKKCYDCLHFYLPYFYITLLSFFGLVLTGDILHICLSFKQYHTLLFVCLFFKQYRKAVLLLRLLKLVFPTCGEKVSKLSLVDLAGSERAAKTGAAGERLKEGSNINKSLTTLGLVISALADQGAGKNKNKFVPYRDSVLTWLLKDSLGGNSRTAMVATVSPAADNYDETLSTLRYADRAKSIVNHAVINEDPNARIIRELREEVEKLREQLTQAESMKAPELKDRLEESEKLIQEMTVTWEEKLRKTEAIAQERQKQLESLGISLQSSGIRVGEDKCFLVNLNADPALNELLVYYLKDHTLVGAADSQDIQLCGMGIQAEHCVIDITAEGQVILTPHRNSRTCVNGSAVSSPVQLYHGDRILWGNNHFFRINLPKRRSRGEREEEEGVMKNSGSSEQLEGDGDTASEVSSEVSFSYELAQTEVMMKALGNNDPMQAILMSLERHHEEEKRSALERQRLMYEQELEQLRRRLSPDKQQQHYRSMERLAASPSAQQKLRQWSEEREAVLTRSLRKLREQIVRANLLVQEASFIAEELEKRTEYHVTLQIPASNLNANRKRDAVLSEPAVQVRRKGKGKQIWALEKMENRLVDMRELYQEWKDFDEDNPVMRSYFKRADPFFDEQENHSLIGVANVFLSCLFYDVKLQYAVPIINQKGEVAGRLHVEVVRVSGDFQERLAGGEDPESSAEAEIKILQATGLPQYLSNFVFCQYSFWDQSEPIIVAPEVDPSASSPASKDPQCMVVFDHCKELAVTVSEDFIEYLTEGAVAIQVYGHKQTDPRRNFALWDLGIIQAKTRTLRDRWSEVTRKVELWVQILELNENGEYVPVEVVAAKDVRTGGIFQLRQGQSRRIQVEVRSVQDSGTMPLIAESVLAVSVGCVEIRQARSARSGESQEERDLERLRRQWLTALTKRQEYLDQHLQNLVSKQDKSEDDVDRESQLLECRLTLTEERNAVMVPSAGSGIPGAPAEWIPVPGMETHIPVLFLDLSADDFSSQDNLDQPEAGGWDATLSGEDEDEFFELQIVKHHDGEVNAEASWDSTVHNCPQLSRGAAPDQRVYLTIKTTVQLSHPADMQLILRKRICVNVTGRQGFAQSFLRRMSHRSTIPACGVTFEIVSNIPGDAEGSEDREMLARLATSVENQQSADTEAAIEKYLRSVLAVENILTLDRLRQEVAVKEHLAGKGKGNRRSLSSPNVHRLSGSRQDLSPSSQLENKGRWESQQDISLTSSQFSRTPRHPSLSKSAEPEAVPLGISGLAASYLSPVKALVPQMPKLLKSLFPVRDDKKDLRPSPLAHQVGIGVSLSHTSLRFFCVAVPCFCTFFLSLPAPLSRLSLSPFSVPLGISGLAASYLSPVKALVPQMPKLLKSLFPVRDDKKDLRPSPLAHQNCCFISWIMANYIIICKTDMIHTLFCKVSKNDSISPAAPTIGSARQYEKYSPPESISTADGQYEKCSPVKSITVLEGHDDKHSIAASLAVVDRPSENHEVPSVPETPDVPQSPASEASSGYFSASISTATLSEASMIGLHLHQSQGSVDKNGITSPETIDTTKPQEIKPQMKPEPALLKSSASNPFKIQKVKTSDLKSFTRILAEETTLQEDGNRALVERSMMSREPAETEQLEIGSDPEEAKEAALPDWLKEGEYVTVGTSKSGVVRYIGPTDFSDGVWVGVELDVPAGKNDGSVGGKQYFKCNPGYGVLVRPDRVSRSSGSGKRRGENRRTGNFSGSNPNLAALTAMVKGEGAARKGENRKSWNS